jgi:hypothetical protein
MISITWTAFIVASLPVLNGGATGTGPMNIVKDWERLTQQHTIETVTLFLIDSLQRLDVSSQKTFMDRRSSFASVSSDIQARATITGRVPDAKVAFTSFTSVERWNRSIGGTVEGFFI